MKNFFINNGGWISLGLALSTLAFDDFFEMYLQPFENSLPNVITYFLITLFPVSLGIYHKNKK